MIGGLDQLHPALVIKHEPAHQPTNQDESRNAIVVCAEAKS